MSPSFHRGGLRLNHNVTSFIAMVCRYEGQRSYSLWNRDHQTTLAAGGSSPELLSQKQIQEDHSRQDEGAAPL